MEIYPYDIGENQLALLNEGLGYRPVVLKGYIDPMKRSEAKKDRIIIERGRKYKKYESADWAINIYLYEGKFKGG